MAVEITGAGMRVAKYDHRLGEVLNLGRRELALLCVLMLRGRQTPGELRSRSDRMHSFADLDEVEACLNHLIEMGLALRLARQAGEKELRYCHLLSDEQPAAAVETLSPAPPERSRLDALEAQVAHLSAELEDVKEQFAAFRKQFD